VLERARKGHEFKRAVVDHLAKNLPPSSMGRLMALAEEQAKINEALVRWAAENAALHGAVAVVINPPGLGLAANLARGLTDAEVSVATEERGDLM